ncbi:MAG: CoA transferase [Ilumatobacteraceae bacterium]
MDAGEAHGGPLAGVTVLDVTTTLLGPYCTLQLAQFGATVVKVESLSGDIGRQLTPGRSPDMSGLHLSLNRGKMSLAIDLKVPQARQALDSVVAGADVVVHNMRRRAAEHLHLDYESVRRIRPDVVHCAAYGFDVGGPYAERPAYDDIIQAAAGVATLQANVAGAPAYFSSAVVDKLCGVVATSAICAALFERRSTGRGQEIVVPMFETMAAFLLVEHLADATFVPELGPPGYPRVLSPYRNPYRTLDGYISVLLYTDEHWKRFFMAVEGEHPVDDPRFTSASGRAAHIDEVYGYIEPLFATRTTDDWMAALQAADVPCARVAGLDDLLHDPQLEAVGLFEHSEHPTEGMTRQPRLATSFGNHRGPSGLPPAPRLGEHSVAVLRQFGVPDGLVDELVATGAVVQAAIPTTTT